MALGPGDAVGPYRVIASIGAGGMGEVFKATDSRLRRTVAIKVIGREGDRPELAQRFAAEARAVAALSHPHICALYDIGQHLGQHFLVLEYLEGKTLAERLRSGPLSPREILGYAIEMADALDYAHRHGIVHRDLKPANVLLTRDGGAKLLDFGLAKLRSTTSQSDSSAALATEPAVVTAEGALVGTLNYLSPERLDGHEAGVPADVFAFGAVLHEMVTGRKAFDEPTQARVIAAILASDPAALRRPPDAPARLWWVMQHCLHREPGSRWWSMGDVAKVLKDLASEGVETTALHEGGRRRDVIVRVTLGLLGIAVLGLGLGSWFAWSRGRDAVSTRPAIITAILPPPETTFALTARSAQFALAPHGQSLAFVARAGGVQQLWVRDLGVQEARALPGTIGASFPFWSPDGRSIAFFADNALKKVGLTGRPAVPLCEAVTGRGGTWVDDHTIVFSPDNSTPLHTVSAYGGTPKPLTSLEPGHFSHRWPQALPGGNLLFFVRSADADQQGLYVTSLALPAELRQLRSTTSSAVYASGRLLYVVDGQVVAQAFDASSLTLSGEAIPLGVQVTVASTLNPALAVSTAGALVGWNNTGDSSDLVWHDRRGNRLGTAGASDRYVDFRLSPDDRRLAVSRLDARTDTIDLVVFDLLNRAAPTSLSSSPQTDASPIWSPDGLRLVFRSNRQGVHDLFERAANGGGADRLLYSLGLGMYPTDWSPERDAILFHALGRKTRHDIWMFSPSAPDKPQALHPTPSEEVQAQLAPGGRLAYASDESGVMTVYVRNLDDPAGPTNVSVDGGVDPRWSADGRELFYLSPSGTLMSAEFPASGPLRVLRTTRLFDTAVPPASTPYLSQYVVTRDGARFLIHLPSQPANASPLTLMLDWPSTLSDRPR